MSFCWVVSGQLKCLFVGSVGMFKKSNEPSSIFSSPIICTFICKYYLYKPIATKIVWLWALRYEFAGIKQSREPRYAYAYEGAPPEDATTKPADAP